MKIKITRINQESDLPLPSYATEGSAGMDVYADINEPITIASQETVMIPTGLAIELPEGYECQVRSRSGLAAKFGVFALNAPGTIDPDYRGEIKVILSNFSDKEFEVKRGDRIAQLVIAQFVRAEWNLVDDLNNTERGSGGFGSTGIEGRK
jgi:dUTP pyrophosphatase